MGDPMTTAIIIGLLVVLLLIGLELLWDWRKSGRIFCTPLPRRYRDREVGAPLATAAATRPSRQTQDRDTGFSPQ